MINVSESIKKAYEESTTQYDKIVIDGQEYEINNVKYEDDCYYEGNIFGTAIARTLDFEIENIIDLENKEFEYLTGIKTENGIEWISLGNFITQEVEPNDTTRINKVNAMDYMLKSNIPYKSDLNYESGTITILQVLQEACQKAGIELATTDFANANFIVDSNQFDENSLIRQVFQAVAQISGTFAKVRFDNKLYFKTPKRQGLKVKDVNKMLVKDLNALPVYKLSLANFKMKLNDYSELILKRNTHPINLVSLGMSNVEGENVVLRDEESIKEDGENSLIINDNPFAYTEGKRKQLINELFDKVKGFEYTSFEIKGQAKPFQETGDEVAVIDSDGTYSSSFLFRFNYKSPNGLESEMSAPSITKATVNYQNVATAEQISKRTELRVDKQEQKILGIIEQQTETGDKLTQVEQTLDGITQRVESIQDLTQTVEGVKTITLANCVEGDLLELHIYGNNNVFKYLYPSDTLFPSNTLYPYGDSRIVVTDQNNNSTTYELGVTDTLRKNGDVCDEYILAGGQAKVVRRINKNGTIKSTETIENLGEYSIRLKNGTNKISIKNYTATIKAKYAIQNDYTEIFSTKVETKTAIEQTAEDIDISVNKKLESYSTTTEMNTAINLKADSITSSVSKSYATKNELTTAKTEIKQTTDSISSVVSNKVGNNEIISKINQSSETVGINANKIKLSANNVLDILSGNTINLKTKNIKIESNNFSVDENGNIVAKSGTIGGWTVNSEAIFNGKGLGQEGSVGMSCKIDDWAFWAGNGVFKVSPSGALTATNATITGKITASSGAIGGAQIDGNGLYFNNNAQSTGWGLWGTTAHAGIVIHAGAKSDNIGGAPFKVYHDGTVYMTKGEISGGIITSGINASNITGGSLSMSRIKGGTLDVKCDEGYLRVGVGYKHPTVSGLNVMSNGINVNDGRLIITSGGNWSYIRSSYGLDNIRLLDSSGSNIPCGGSDYMSFMDIAMVVKYCREHGYSSNI